MKKIIFLFLFVTASISMAIAAGVPAKKSVALAQPSASFQKMWIDYGETVEGRYGMMMHIAFTVYNMKGIEGQLVCYFKYTDGKPESLITHRKAGDRYHTAEGQLAVAKNYTPPYDAAIYEDAAIFFPYDEFGLDPGKYNLTIDVQFRNPTNGQGIAWLQLYDIEYTSYDNSRGPGSTPSAVKAIPPATTGPRASFDSMWVDYDVKEEGELGMRLHFKFTAYDMKDVESYVAVYFEYDDAKGGALKDNNGKYASSGGYVAVYRDVNPGFAAATYDDLQIFMPYNELDLSPGSYQLVMDTKLIYKAGGLISNFTYHAFDYTKPAR